MEDFFVCKIARQASGNLANHLATILARYGGLICMQHCQASQWQPNHNGAN